MPMIDLDKLAEIIADYKREFNQYRPDEIYKWEAVKPFSKTGTPKPVIFMKC